jgi:hypothetical protein
MAGSSYTLTLRRDVIADYYKEIIESPCFIEKALLNINDPGIWNSENMTFNQILANKYLLKDNTKSAWIVGYLPKNAPAEQKKVEADFITSANADITVDNFENWDFSDIKSQFNEEYVLCDAIRYKGVVNGQNVERYCANMFNIGFDCNVADETSTLKKYPFIKGSLAYFLSIFVMLVKKKGANFKLEIDGREVHNGKLLLTSIANGCYCGGGIKSNPLAEVNDGLININIIKNVSRLRFISLLPYYMKGTFLKLKGIDKVIASEKCSEVVITPECGKIRLCIDGEIVDAGKTRFKALHNAFNFVIPAKMAKRETIREYVIPCNGQHIQ